MINILSYDAQNTELASLKFTKYSDDYYHVKDNFYHYTRKVLPAVFNLFLDVNYQVPTRYIDHDRSLRTSNSNPDNLYPIAVRYISDKNVHVIERPPFKISIDFKNARAAYDAPKVEPVEIWIPWTVMIFPWNQIAAGDSGHLKLYFNDGPIQSLSDCVVPVYLPNAYPDGRICWSNSFNMLLSQLNVSSPESVDINYLYSSILNDYLMGGWNTDLNFHYRSLQYRDSASFNNLISSGDFPMLSSFVDTLKSNPELAQNVRNVLQEKFHFTKRKSLSCIDGSVIKDRNSALCSKDIFLKLFAFMSSISLSDTLKFVSELKQTIKHPIKIEDSIIVNENYSYHDDDSSIVLATTSPIKNTVVNNSINSEYQTIKAFLVYIKDYSPEESGFISYSSRRGDNFPLIIDADFEEGNSLYELIYLDIYRLCKNRYNMDPDKPFVIVVDGDTKTLSVHDVDYLDKLFFQVATEVKKSFSNNKSLKSNIRVSTYVSQNLEQQNA